MCISMETKFALAARSHLSDADGRCLGDGRGIYIQPLLGGLDGRANEVPLY